uniref:Uncharacterized protein n=1 Tax=Myotis myotis TaxID=51298 RepID=A0A7J7WHL3_MYOMY|nr:hypothetical protein mMyoMyo1_012027 [Myotis myotis]
MGRLRHHPLSRTEQGQSGGWGAPPCHSQSRANRGVGAPPPVTHRAGPIRGLGRRHCHTEGRADGQVMALPHHTQSRARGGGRGWGAAPCHTQSRVDREVVAPPLVTHRAAGRSGSLGAAPCHADSSAGRPLGSADPGAGRHITLLLYRIEAWCTGGGRLVCPEGCPGSGWGSPLGCLASLGEGLMAVCSWSHPLQGGGPHWGAWPVWVRG